MEKKKGKWLISARGEGGNLSQVIDDRRDGIKNILDFRISSESTEAEADSAVSLIGGNSGSDEDMGRFERTACTGRAGRGADTQITHHQEHGFAFDILEGNIGSIWRALNTTAITI